MRNITAFIIFCNNKCNNIDNQIFGDIMSYYGKGPVMKRKDIFLFPHELHALCKNCAQDIKSRTRETQNAKERELLRGAYKTALEISILAPRVRGVWLAEFVAAMWMMVYNWINTDDYSPANLIVYPTMLVAFLCIIPSVHNLDKKVNLFEKQMDAINQKQRN